MDEQYYGLFHWLRTIGTPTPSATKIIGVTGCGMGAGVSTVAANLALAAAKAGGEPALHMDLSGNTPLLASQFNMLGDLGLRAALASEARLSDCVKESPVANLFLLAPSGANAAESMNIDGGRVHELLALLEREYRFIVVDLPPADSALCFAVAGAMSGVLLVIDADQTRYDAAMRAKQRLLYANAMLLGVILNEQSYRTPF